MSTRQLHRKERMEVLLNSPPSDRAIPSEATGDEGSTQMLRGLTTVSFWAADLAAAKKWYAELLGIDLYFERPGYAEFRLGDYQHELGLIDSRYAPAGSATGRCYRVLA